jgi:Ni/Co efflux regulator RcnB
MKITPMQVRRAVATLMALTMATGGMAFAQGNSDRSDRNGRGNERNDRGNDRNDRDHRNDRGYDRSYDRSYDRGPGPGHGHSHAGPRGAGPNHSYYRGDRMPPAYRGQRYIVNDWQVRRLHAPPRGYHWVQTGGDYVLVAIATGVILELLLNN